MNLKRYNKEQLIMLLECFDEAVTREFEKNGIPALRLIKYIEIHNDNIDGWVKQ